MSFASMKRDDLYELATENFAVDVAETATKPQIIAALAENGVSWEMAKTYDKNAAAVEEVEEPSAPVGVITAAQTKAEPAREVVEVEVAPVEVPAQPEVVLIKMDRENPRYDIRGYRFTRDNPFALVKTEDADFILGHEDGFKMASPGEAKEFYG